MVTPRPRIPRVSGAGMGDMPPPPSPSNISRVVQARQADLEEEIRELKRRNAEVEAELAAFRGVNGSEIVSDDLLAAREEAESLRRQLVASQADAMDATRLAEELHGQLATGTMDSSADREALQTREKELEAMREEMARALEEIKSDMDEKDSAIERLGKENLVNQERAAGELAAGGEARRQEVADMEDRAMRAEQHAEEMNSLVEELTAAGQVRIYRRRLFRG